MAQKTFTLEQYQTALWFVRYLYRYSGVIASASECVIYYQGFIRGWNRDTQEYPNFISGVTFAHALLAWQYNPNQVQS